MEEPPLKRSRCAASTEDSQLTLLRGLMCSEVALQLDVSSDALTLSAGGLSVKAPDRFRQRAQLLQQVPEGHLKTSADVFATWLAVEWRRDLNVEAFEPVQADEDDVRQAFQLLKTCNYLQDEAGVGNYGRAVHACLLQSPVMCTLPLVERLHKTHKRSALPYILLEELPRDLARCICAIDPLAVLDRLPLDSSALAALCVELHNEGVQRMERQIGTRLDAWRPGSDLWTWRSALAEHAGVQMQVAAWYDDWADNGTGKLHGLQVVKFCVRQAKTLKLTLPDELIFLDISGRFDGARGWQALSLPSSLQVLRIDLRGDLPQVGGQPMRLRVAHLAFPAQLVYLELGVHWLDLSNVVLPPQLTELSLHDRHVLDDCAAGISDTRSLCLPPSLQALSIEPCKPGADGFDQLTLPPALKSLCLSIRADDLSAEHVRSLSFPSSLTRLQLEVAWLPARELMPALALPRGLVSLTVECQRGVLTDMIELPPALTQLDVGCNDGGDDFEESVPEGQQPQVIALPQHLRDFSVYDSGIFATAQWQALPNALTCLTFSYTNLGGAPEAPQALPWPQALERLLVHGCTGAGALSLCGLPPSVRDICLSDTTVSFLGVQLPESLEILVLQDVNFWDDAELADVVWPATSLTGLSIASVPCCAKARLNDLRLPDSIIGLTLQHVCLAERTSDVLRLPRCLQSLGLTASSIGAGGLQCLELPCSLTSLHLSGANLGPCGLSGVSLPDSIKVLDLRAHVDRKPVSLDVPRFRWPSSLDDLQLWIEDPAELERVCRSLPRSLSCLSLFGCRLDSSDVFKWLDDSVSLQLFADKPSMT